MGVAAHATPRAAHSTLHKHARVHAGCGCRISAPPAIMLRCGVRRRQHTRHKTHTPGRATSANRHGRASCTCVCVRARMLHVRMCARARSRTHCCVGACACCLSGAFLWCTAPGAATSTRAHARTAQPVVQPPQWGAHHAQCTQGKRHARTHTHHANTNTTPRTHNARRAHTKPPPLRWCHRATSHAALPARWAPGCAPAAAPGFITPPSIPRQRPPRLN